MPIERCIFCERLVDLDWYVEDIIYDTVEYPDKPICIYCVENKGLITQEDLCKICNGTGLIVSSVDVSSNWEITKNESICYECNGKNAYSGELLEEN